MKNTQEKSLLGLLESGFYRIPDFQRSYAWEDEQLEDLWNDMVYLPENKNHFFGNIVLQDTGRKVKEGVIKERPLFEVIDGQQRLITTIIILTVVKNHTDNNLDESIEDIIEPTIGKARIEILDQDQEYFRKKIIDEVAFPNEDTPSQERLKNAKNFFKKRIKEAEINVEDLISKFLSYFILNVIHIEDEEEEAAMFETINDRGKQLTSLEKTKSFLMNMSSLTSDNFNSQITEIKREFGNIYKNLFVLSDGHESAENFDEDNIQTYHWGIYDGYERDEYYNAGKTLKKRLRTEYQKGKYEEVAKKCLNYAEDLRQASSAFENIFRPEKQDGMYKTNLFNLLELKRLATIMPLLIASFIKLKDRPKELNEIIDILETLVFRVYIIDRRRSDTGLSKLVRLAHKYYKNKVNIEEVKSKLKEITKDYASDSRLENDLKDNSFYYSVPNRGIKYVLYHYEKNLRKGISEEIDLDLQQILSEDFEVEHILARKLEKKDRPSSLKDEEKFNNIKHSLGNLTLIYESWNPHFGNKSFEEKKRNIENEDLYKDKSYNTSSLKVLQNLSAYNKFGEKEIDDRTEELANFILDYWKI